MAVNLRTPLLSALLLMGAAAIAVPAMAQDPAPADPAAPAAPAVTAEPATPAEPAAPAAPASEALPPNLTEPTEGMGQIVFFRPSRLLGAAIGFKVREGETELGKLGNGNCFVSQVTPGTHTYVVHSEAKDELTLEVEAGETYYVSGAIGMGIVAGRPNISPSDTAAFVKSGLCKKK